MLGTLTIFQRSWPTEALSRCSKADHLTAACRKPVCRHAKCAFLLASREKKSLLRKLACSTGIAEGDIHRSIYDTSRNRTMKNSVTPSAQAAQLADTSNFHSRVLRTRAQSHTKNSRPKVSPPDTTVLRGCFCEREMDRNPTSLTKINNKRL